MLTSPVKQAVVFALSLLQAACHGKGERGTPDAGRTTSAPQRVVAARIPQAGELLADLSTSKISASMIKDRNVAVPVTATMLLRDGRVTLDGPQPSARLSIDMTTFDSALPLRNERVKQFFFETNNRNYETVELSIPVLPPEALRSLREARKALHVKLDGELTFHGAKKKIELVVDASYDASGTLVVKSAGPIDVNVSDYGLLDNLRRLSLLCKHESIDEIVKAEVTIEFPPK
jgi:hypothetical protein